MMTLLPAPDVQALRDQALRLAEPQRAELISALLDSMRPPSRHASADELAREIENRAEAYHRGELGAIDLDESMRIARQAAQSGRVP